MRIRPLLLAALAAPALALAFAAPPEAASTAMPTEAEGRFNVDTVHSMALFRVQHLGAGQFWGRFNDVKGTIEYRSDAAANALAFDISIDTGSVDSGHEGLDRHLRSPDFFNSKEFPAMTFKSVSASPASSGMWKVEGDLTMLGVTRRIAAEVEFTGAKTMRDRRCGFEAVFTIRRSDFGMNWGIENGSLGDSVRVIVGLEGIAS
jgi:polyisoprenoid-binding protein YceI